MKMPLKTAKKKTATRKNNAEQCAAGEKPSQATSARWLDAFEGFGDPNWIGQQRAEKKAAEKKARISTLFTTVLLERGALRECFKPTLNELGRAPSDAQIGRLNAAVEELAQLIRTRKKPHLLWDCYTAVDREFLSVKLIAGIRRLFERARKHVPPRPLEFFNELRLSGDASAHLAAELIERASEFRRETVPLFDPSKVEWRRFAGILYRYRNPNWKGAGGSPELLLKTKARKPSPNPDATAYAVFQEVMIEDDAWTRRHWGGVWRLLKWAMMNLQNEPLVHVIGRFFFPSDATKGIAEQYERHREIWRKVVQNARQLRHRAKKKGKIA